MGEMQKQRLVVCSVFQLHEPWFLTLFQGEAPLYLFG
jgi:hypothetical protein